MKLYHITSTATAQKIQSQGFDPRRATGKWKASWFVTSGMIQWAIVHTLQKKRQGMSEVEELSVIEVSIPRSWLRRFKTGMWMCFRPVPASRIQAIAPATDWGKE